MAFRRKGSKPKKSDPVVILANNYKEHKQRWKNCDRCDLCSKRNKVVLLRGTIPAPVLFVGEAPGFAEDVTGTPFVPGAPAGGLLSYIIQAAGLVKGDYAITNLISCIPRDPHTNSVTLPPNDSIRACRERLVECIALTDPQLIIAVGTIADRWLVPKHIGDEFASIPKVAIIHPAAILRMHVAQRGIDTQRAIIQVRDGLEQLRG
jgi:uracil-DNA glycosylase family 4